MSSARWLSLARAALGILHGSRAFGGPLQASLNLTNRCNVRCVHCYFHSPHATQPNFLDTRRDAAQASDANALRRRLTLQADADRVAAALDALLAAGTRRFQFSGNGEVFVHPDALRLMARVKRRGAYVLANTNGTLLDRPVVDALIAMGFDDLRVTTMAGTADVYARTHAGAPPALFERLRENLLYLRERKAALKAARPRLSMATVIIAPNAEDLLNTARFAVETGACQAIFRLFDDVGDPGLAPIAPAPGQAEGVRRQLREAAAYLDAHGVRHNVTNALAAFGRERRLDTTALYRAIPCYYGWLSMRVDVLGEVYFCCRCATSIGNLFDEGLDAVWNGDVYRRMRRAALALPQRRASVADCDCNACVHHNANIRAFHMLHPWRRLPEAACPDPAEAED